MTEVVTPPAHRGSPTQRREDSSVGSRWNRKRQYWRNATRVQSVHNSININGPGTRGWIMQAVGRSGEVHATWLEYVDSFDAYHSPVD